MHSTLKRKWLTKRFGLFGLIVGTTLMSFQNCAPFEAKDPGAMSRALSSSGSGSDVPPRDDDPTTPDVLSSPKSQVRRLSNDEFDRTVGIIFGDMSRPASLGGMPEDAIAPFDNDATLQNPTQPLVDGLERVAAGIADRFTTGTTVRNARMPCQPSQVSDSVCLKKFVEQFGRLSLHRRLATSEVQAFVSAALPFAAEESNFYAAVNVAIRSFIMHPEFVYRVEKGTATVDGRIKLTGNEIATNLSLLLVGATPDTALLDAAERGDLNTPAGIRMQAERLLGDARAQARMDRFHAMWLGYERTPLDPTMAAAMRAESFALVKKTVFDDNAAWTGILQSDKTYIPDSLATHYGLPASGQAGSHWISYGTTGRKGLLSHGSFLSVAGKFGDTSPTLRGKLIRNKLLCQEIPPPPPTADVDSPPTDPIGNSACKFKRYAAHRAPGTSCFSCHQLTDPVGFGLENYDQFGRFRSTDVNHPECAISGDGEITGLGKFNGPGQLSDLVVSSGNLERCLVSQVYHFALGQKPSNEEAAAIDQLTVGFKRDGLVMKKFLIDLVSSPTFIYRGVRK